MINENNNILLKELIDKQLYNIYPNKKLQYQDIKRICKYINTSIFDPNKCCIWNGYIANINNYNKGTYINFYFRKKKIALHRLLYVNFIGKLNNDEYLKFTCKNNGTCCNITHLKKFQYKKQINHKIKKNSYIQKPKTITIKNLNTINKENINELYLSFD